MTSKVEAIDHLIDALAGRDVVRTSGSVAANIDALATMIEDGTISIGGGGAPILRCHLTYTGTGTQADPYVGHLTNASAILDALDHESAYDPIIVIDWAFGGNTGQLIPTVACHFTSTYEGEEFHAEIVNAYGHHSNAYIESAFYLQIIDSGNSASYEIEDYIAGVSSETIRISDDVIIYGESAH